MEVCTTAGNYWPFAVAVKVGSAEIVCELAFIRSIIYLYPPDVMLNSVGVGYLFTHSYIELDPFSCLNTVRCSDSWYMFLVFPIR